VQTAHFDNKDTGSLGAVCEGPVGVGVLTFGCDNLRSDEAAIAFLISGKFLFVAMSCLVNVLIFLALYWLFMLVISLLSSLGGDMFSSLENARGRINPSVTTFLPSVFSSLAGGCLSSIPLSLCIRVIPRGWEILGLFFSFSS